MYRHVILDFLSSNRKGLQDNQITQMTIVLFQEEDSDMSQCCIAKDAVLVYHIKEPYVFEKEYAIDQMGGTLVEIALEFESPMLLQKEEFSYTILEPYGLKDVLTIDFKSLIVQKIEKTLSKTEKKLLGIAILYSQMNHPQAVISNQKLLTLKKRLEKDTFSDVLQHVQEIIFSSQSYYLVLYHSRREFYYCNDVCVKALELTGSFVAGQDADALKIEKKLPMMQHITLEEWEVYYLSQHLSWNEERNHSFYAMASLEEHPFVSTFTLIYIRDLKQEMDAIKLRAKWESIVQNNMLDVLYQCYWVDSDAIVIVCNRSYKKREILNVTYYLKHLYTLFVSCPGEIDANMQLQPLVEYIHEQLPEQFSYAVYCQYLDQNNREKLLWDAVYPRKKYCMIQAKDEHLVGNLVIRPIPNGYSKSLYRIFEESAIRLMEESIHKQLEMPVYTVLVTSFSRKKVVEVLKKVIKTYPDAKLILHIPPIYQIETKRVYEVVNQCIAMGFVVIVDSTIYMNLQYNIALSLVDALLIRENETIHSLLNHNSLNQLIFKEMYQQNKVIIFETIPNEEDAEMVNELTCLIVER
ncbi:MAG: hypothetical protein NC182_00275 [Prevotella sp.]|nr:hypothetical protein [Staphylococcus sp.]MCM1349619.1 hypothetical protein [Prevotella sp.]